MIPILILKMIPKKTCNMRARISSATFTLDELKLIHSAISEASRVPEKDNELWNVMAKIKALMRPRNTPPPVTPVRFADIKKMELNSKES